MSRHDSAPIEWPRRIPRLRFAWPSLDPLMLGAFAAFLGLLVLALLGDRIAPHEPIYFVVEHGSDPRPYDPGLVFPLGSDVLGRDLFSLVLAGARRARCDPWSGRWPAGLAGHLEAAHNAPSVG